MQEMKEEIKTAIQSEVKSFLTFRLDKEQFAVHVKDVIEILTVPKITKVPRSPDYLIGVINLRGNVLPVIDTRLKFSMEPTSISADTCVVVMIIEVETEQITVGALVDAVYQVVEIESSTIKKSPSIGSNYSPEFIEGVARVGDDFVMVLNIGKVFLGKEIAILENATNQENKS